MSVRLCPHCQAPLRVRPDQAAGRCPRCRHVLPPAPAGEFDFLRPPAAPGELGRLGEYRVRRVLGSGAMGVVFEAEDTRLNRRVALKVMKKAGATSDEDREQFLREARSTAAIEHDHIVTIYQVGEDNNVPFLAMKLLVGESLEERLRRDGALDPEEVIRLGREIAEGLAAAHERGLIHRDIKPANIWLEEGSGRVKIVDFGLARGMEEGAEEAERNWLVGTPLYMSPEQSRGRELDARSDLFSLGAVLYRAATGELAFKGRTIRAAIAAVRGETPKPPREVNPAVPPYLSRLIMDLLEKSPDDRPFDARRLVAALADALDRIDEKPPEERDERVVEADEEPEARKPKGRKPKRKGAEEYTLEGRVIWWSVFAGACVALLLTFLIVRSIFFS